MRLLLSLIVLGLVPAACAETDLPPAGAPRSAPVTATTTTTAPGPTPDRAAAAPAAGKLVKTDDEWRRLLTAEQFHILREKGTERPFTGKLWNHHEPGVYVCAGCGQELFSSQTKFDSGTGWPSFWQPVSAGAIESHSDATHGMQRTEVVCSRCGGHLGHVFEDGPEPTGLRYCINSGALDVKPAGL